MRSKTWKKQSWDWGCPIAPLFWSQKEAPAIPWCDPHKDPYKIISFRLCSQEQHHFVKWGFSLCSTQKHQQRRVGRECRGRENGNFPFFKPEGMVATTMWPPLPGLTSRKWRKDQKQVEIKRIKLLKFFCFATGCHPSSTYHSARQEHSVQSKEK